MWCSTQHRRRRNATVTHPLDGGPAGRSSRYAIIETYRNHTSLQALPPVISHVQPLGEFPGSFPAAGRRWMAAVAVAAGIGGVVVDGGDEVLDGARAVTVMI